MPSSADWLSQTDGRAGSSLLGMRERYHSSSAQLEPFTAWPKELAVPAWTVKLSNMEKELSRDRQGNCTPDASVLSKNGQV